MLLSRSSTCLLLESSRADARADPRRMRVGSSMLAYDVESEMCCLLRPDAGASYGIMSESVGCLAGSDCHVCLIEVVPSDRQRSINVLSECSLECSD